MKPPILTASELTRRLADEYSDEFHGDSGLSIVDVGHGTACLRLEFRPSMIRPGGTISGPTIMKLADLAMYVALLGTIGWQPLAVTTNLTVNFMRKPQRKALVAECRLLKVGKRLAVGEVAIRPEHETALVAQATATYSIPS